MEIRSGLALSAARREFEPALLNIGPASGSIEVEIYPFPNLSSAQRVELAEVDFESGIAESLTPIEGRTTLTLSAAQTKPLWITVYVPEDAPAGNHETSRSLTPTDGETITVPIRLYVFDFAIPDDIHFATQLNISVESLVAETGSVEDAKTLLFEHRMTPKSATWPSEFKYNITWDSERSPDRCEAFYDEPDEPVQFSIGSLAAKYILGEGWNGIGFPNAMLFQFEDNATPRPASFCSIARGDHFGTSAYNAKWSQFLSAVEGYLIEKGYTDKAYYYVQNEPQDEDDAKLAAHLCALSKTAAPRLRLAISEEPKPNIAEDPDHPCGYDIWIAHVRAYQQDYAWERQSEHGEEVWFYSLDSDPDPYFNPTRIENQGMHARIIPWVAWGLRISGYAYYDFGRFFDGSRPSVRAELFREGFEDYEYLYLANGGSRPMTGESEIADSTASSVAASLTSWTQDPDALMALRHQLGLYIEGTRGTLHVLEIESSARSRGAYYLNFQDPSGQPSEEPLTVAGKNYLKVGWDAYNENDAYGWSGEFIDDATIALYGFDETSGYSSVQRSYLYDDYGRDNLFEFDLENGRYEVTVGVGRPARGYPGDPHNLTIEGMRAVDDEVTTDAAPTITRSQIVDLRDGRLTLEVGGKSSSTDDFAYTFLAYLEITPLD